jgi:hypothetical protein
MRTFLALLAAIISGILVGLAMFFLDRAGFYLVLLVPLIGGSLIGTVVRAAGGNRTRTLVLVVCAILGGVIATGLYWFGQYNDYSEQLIEQVQQRNRTATREEALKIIETIQQDEFGSTGFPAFLADYAEMGISISRVGSSSALDVQGNFAYALWAGEALLLIVMAIATVRRRQQAVTPAAGAPAM